MALLETILKVCDTGKIREFKDNVHYWQIGVLDISKIGKKNTIKLMDKNGFEFMGTRGKFAVFYRDLAKHPRIKNKTLHKYYASL
ncbi:hypothetical protein GF358_03195 [Candidatus Woesearchaeota archaeon]|nr:hypothetical protein [Candidatus Woesearchaeota archaeon]